MAKNRRQKVPKSDFQSRFSTSKILQIFLKRNLLKNINLGATFLSLSILCSIKIERLLFLKFLKILAFFDSYFWPFNKTHKKIIAIFVISAIKASIWNIFIKFRWHDKKLTTSASTCRRKKGWDPSSRTVGDFQQLVNACMPCRKYCSGVISFHKKCS